MLNLPRVFYLLLPMWLFCFVIIRNVSSESHDFAFEKHNAGLIFLMAFNFFSAISNVA